MNHGGIRQPIDDDTRSADEITRRCGAGDICGGCADTIAGLLAQHRGTTVAIG